MIDNRKLDLQMFTEGGAGAGDGDGSGGSEADVRIGDTLEDGTIVDANLASSMRENADMYPARRREARAQGKNAEGESSQQASGGEPGDEPTAEEWAAIKKKYGKFYGSDVAEAVNHRFKNQKDVTGELEKYQHTMGLLMQKAGVENFQEFSRMVEDDDSIYEEAADAAGMTVEGYKAWKEMQDENKQLKKAQEQQAIQQHIAGIREQAKKLQKLFPNFSLDQERQNEKFVRMTAPSNMGGAGMSVEEAFYALYGKDLLAQTMAYGVKQGKDQISRSIQANQARPMEGASRRAPSNVNIHMDTENMTDDQYEMIKRKTLQEGPQAL